MTDKNLKPQLKIEWRQNPHNDQLYNTGTVRAQNKEVAASLVSRYDGTWDASILNISDAPPSPLNLWAIKETRFPSRAAAQQWAEEALDLLYHQTQTNV